MTMTTTSTMLILPVPTIPAGAETRPGMLIPTGEVTKPGMLILTGTETQPTFQILTNMTVPAVMLILPVPKMLTGIEILTGADTQAGMQIPITIVERIRNMRYC